MVLVTEGWPLVGREELLSPPTHDSSAQEITEMWDGESH